MYIKKILWAIALIGLVIAGFFAYYVYNAMLSPNTNFNNDEAYIYIKSTDSYNEVRSQLEPLLKDIASFDVLAEQKKYTSNIKSGKFAIKKGMNNNDIINSIRSENLPIKVSFNNQNSLEKLAGRVANQIEADSLSLLEAMTDTEFFTSNGFTNETALGMYLPNSYELYWNTTAETFRDRMLKEYKRFWNEKRIAKAHAIGLSKDQVMTLASLVYEESKQKSEQARIAGLYINRLNSGIPLDSDPTLKFAAYKLPQYNNTIIRRVLNVHKSIDSPYNTYKNRGLPPGLITMPNISAIEAVLNYEKHKYIFMCADPKRFGYHKFAKTLAQHNANARAYHKYLDSKGIRK
ncbi:endolytic transglycosylase MltG [Hyunsoonleella pacifica]|uniref:Endolytic murein transglycosylase n=1 Tax=Hyunsoonleella pacifica TaxID=1080224 RepID=A0A4Q9FWD9_9FLAO|nr:endolytic transglycosylase MltG [Hyunsoonleella pacifica]TBN18875.1 endolytic transglycosylase MltG [Hyunsoonleella pacifica]GGD05529.1 aminodeoxychorismate lyase [Hyunsoonleella pacifica]